MRKSFLVLCACTLLAGCLSGPNYLRNTWDDHWNNQYESNARITGVLSSVLPWYPVVSVLASIPDVVVLNTVQFWKDDVWGDNQGAAFVHENPAGVQDTWFPHWFDEGGED